MSDFEDLVAQWRTGDDSVMNQLLLECMRRGEKTLAHSIIDRCETGFESWIECGKARITFYLRGARGVVQFVLGIIPESTRVSFGHSLYPLDLGYHRPDGHGQRMPSCRFHDPCYYDGSSLGADTLLNQVLNGADWHELLQEYYERVFASGEDDDDNA